ncbi:MAG: transposase [Myxococcota bacterium]|nr:transposase [Myxococcota bacterium]
MRKSRRASRNEQTVIAFRTWGGRRAGAGRKPTGARAGVPHARRATLTGREPVLVTLKVRRHVWSLRARRTFTRMTRAIGAASDRFGMRIVHFSVQRDHAHLIVEAESRASLVRGIKGLCVRVARAINRAMERTGPVFADRYHERVLTTPRQVRHAIAYVLCNWRKHRVAPRSARAVDPCSSGALFDGWSCAVASCADVGLVVATARTWLLRIGWRRAGPIDPAHDPGRAPA